MKTDDLFKQIYERDVAVTPHGSIQWKGTDVCADLHCKCGHNGHYDGEFLMSYRCPACGTVYAVGRNVQLIELSATEQTVFGDTIKTSTIEDGETPSGQKADTFFVRN